jgi:Fe-S-cluster-containing dehydrogenase component
LNLYNEIAKSAGATVYDSFETNADVKKAATDLLNNKGKSLVVSGTNSLQIQLIINAINQLLGNYGNTIDLTKPVYLKQGYESEIHRMVKEMNDNNIHGLFLYNVNPAYDFAANAEFLSGMSNVPFKVAFTEALNETASKCDYICTTNNYLESWDDAEPVKETFSIMQPTIQPIFNTRQFQDSLLKWMNSEIEYSSYLENSWKEMFGQHAENGSDFGKFWYKFKKDGVLHHDFEENQPTYTPQNLMATKPSDKGLELVLYEKISMGTGKYTNNPWLLEMPDPITTATWDNYVCIPPNFAKEHSLELEDVVKVNDEFELPVIVQPGQPEGTVSIALGYGRTIAGKAGNGVGQNAFPLMNVGEEYYDVGGSKVVIEKINGKKYPLALTQSHHQMEGRPIVRETTLPEYLKNPASGNEQHATDEKNNVTLYAKAEFDGLHWGMTVDLTSCTGCSNCVIACQAENNVAVIGKEQVRKRRIMHWIRIDRYYSTDPENPDVYHMPVMCQQCDNAPCENVCPVAATNHSNEGLNQMAYNRCIGTRYCINNCPYKVRRFNWYEYINNNKFDYNMNSDLGKLVLNPDVVVRQRGVVEKCSFCAQRLQEKKLAAKIQNRELRDGEVQTACSQSCPTGAIQFGNLNDENSVISQNNLEGRMYHLLEKLHTLPSTSYLTMVRNRDV